MSIDDCVQGEEKMEKLGSYALERRRQEEGRFQTALLDATELGVCRGKDPNIIIIIQ